MDLIPPLTNFTSVGNLISGIITYLAGAAAAIAVVFVVIAGFKYMIAGSEQSANEAKSGLVSAILGLIIVALSGAIIKFIVDNFG